MRSAFTADIHGNLQALELTIEDIQQHSVDRIVCLGDGIDDDSKEKVELKLFKGPLLPLGMCKPGFLSME